jgi:hypothetical protein
MIINKPEIIRITRLTVIITTVFLLSFSLTYAAGDFFIGLLWGIVAGVFGFFVGLAGKLLDVSISNFVIGAGASFIDSGIGGAVDTLWSTVRDFFNLTFIFGLVYIGFKMILNSDDSGSRRALVHLILAALLVNFSLFITKFIFDLSNLIASQIAYAFLNDQGEIAVSFTFMSLLGIQTFAKMTETAGEITSMGQVFGALVLFIVMIFSFTAGALMLLIRYAAMILFMVLSPLMFLGWVFPGLQRISNEYWRSFLGRAFFAPVYLLLIYFSVVVLRSFYDENAGTVGGPPQFNKIFDGSQGVEDNFVNTLPPFILSAIFLIASVVVAQKMGADGATGAVNMMNNFKRGVQARVQKTAVGTAKLATAPARTVLRSASAGVGRRLETSLDKFQMKYGVAVGDRAIRGIAKNAQEARFGFEETKQQATARVNAVKERAERGATIRGLQDTNQYGVSADGDGTQARPLTYMEAMQNQREIGYQMNKMSIEEVAKLGYGKLQQTGYVTNLTDEVLKKLESEGHYTGKQVATLRELRDQAQIEPSLNVLNREIEKVSDPGESGTPEEKAKYDNYTENLKALNKEKDIARQYLSEIMPGMSTERLAGVKANAGTSEMMSQRNLAQFITQTQTDQLKKAGIGVEGIEEARTDALTYEAEQALDGTSTSAKELEDAFDKLGRVVKGLSGEKLTSMGTDRLTRERIAMHLSEAQIDTLQQSGKYTVEDIKNIKDARKRGLSAVASGNFTNPIEGGKGSLINPENKANVSAPIDEEDKSKGTFEANQRKNIMRGGAVQAGKLPPEIFAQANMAEHISPTAIEERNKNYMDDKQVEKVRKNMQDYIDRLATEQSTEPDPIGQAKIESWRKWAESPKGVWLGLDVPEIKATPKILDARGKPLKS